MTLPISTSANASDRLVTIVSGLPRSGTSVMMQLVHAGGLPALTDNQRTPDDDNPRGYFEFEAVKAIKRDTSWLNDAVGKVVKMVHLLLLDLPITGDYRYRVVLMRRDLNEVLASQRKMLERTGKSGAGLKPEQLMSLYEQQLSKVKAHLAAHPQHFEMKEISYNELMANPSQVAHEINEFLGGSLDESKMNAAVDPTLYRNRKS